MLHHDLLLRLCRARDLLRDVEGEEKASIAAVAKQAGVARFHFIRLFKSVFGETPRECRARARLEKAKRMLVVDRLPVTEVCMAVGCSSVGSFSAAFSRRTGAAPSNYQRYYRPDPESPHELPRVLVPGCLTLMGGAPREKANQEKRAAKNFATVRRPTITKK